MRLELRPSVINEDLWYPERDKPKVWSKIRRQVLEEHSHRCRFCGHHALKFMQIHHLHLKGKRKPVLVPACVACHAVLHIGLNLGLGIIEIWKSRIPQREIVRRTREGIRKGKSLRQIKATLPISRGGLPPKSIEWANRLLSEMGNRPVSSLKRPYCAVFVDMKRWQLEEVWHRDRIRTIMAKLDANRIPRLRAITRSRNTTIH